MTEAVQGRPGEIGRDVGVDLHRHGDLAVSQDQYVRDVMLAAAYRAGVTVLTTVRLYGADDDTVYLQHTLTNEPVLVESVSALVLAQGHDPVDELFGALGAAVLAEPELGGVQVHAIGDCLAPRTVEEATLEALEVAAGL